jgi:hypothetical protein
MRRRIGLVAAGVLLALSPAAAYAADPAITTDALYNQAKSYAEGSYGGQCYIFGLNVFAAVAQNADTSTRLPSFVSNGFSSSGGGPGYYGCYLQAQGTEVTQDQARRGDYIQIYDVDNPWNAQPTIVGGYSVHTAIIENNRGGGVFDVIDSNYVPYQGAPLERVHHHRFIPANHIAGCGGAPWKVAYWRLGSAAAAPSVPSVTAASETDDASIIRASWSVADAGTGGIVEYQYAVGTAQQPTSVRGWTSAGTATSVDISGMNLDPECIYHVSVKAKNGAGLESVGVGGAARLARVPLDPRGALGILLPRGAIAYTGTATGALTAPGSRSVTFNQPSAGMVSLRYCYNVPAGAAFKVSVDDMPVAIHVADDARTGPANATDHVFLPAGSHTVKLTGEGGTSQILSLLLGLDTSFTPLAAPQPRVTLSASGGPQDTHFTLSQAGLVVIRLGYYRRAASSWLDVLVDGQSVAQYNSQSSLQAFRSDTLTLNLPAGAHTLSLREDDGSGTSDVFGASVGVLPVSAPTDAPTAHIDSVAPNPAVSGQSVTLTGHGSDPAHAITAYSWRSDRDGVLGTGASLVKSGLSVGTHTIYLKVRCAGGTWSPEVSATLVVNEAPLGRVGSAVTLWGPTSCAYGAARLSGSLLTAAGSALSSKTVRVDVSSNGSVFSTLGLVSSGSGSFSIPVYPTATAWYRLTFEGDDTCAPSVSTVVRVVPAVRIGTPSAPKTVKRKRYFTVSGTLSPQHAGSRAILLHLYRWERGKWRQKSTVWAAGKTGGYKASVKLTKSGKWRIRAYHRADAANGAAWSGYLNVKVT